MRDDSELLLRSDPAESPETRRDWSKERPETPAERSPAAQSIRRSGRDPRSGSGAS